MSLVYICCQIRSIGDGLSCSVRSAGCGDCTGREWLSIVGSRRFFESLPLGQYLLAGMGSSFCLGLWKGTSCWCSGFAAEEAVTGSNSDYQDHSEPRCCRQKLSRNKSTCAEKAAAAAAVYGWACSEVPCMINVKLWAVHGTGWRLHTSLDFLWAFEQQQIYIT